MPTPTGLTRPQIGSGRASPGTVDVSAWTNPDQGTDGLRTHVQDPSRAHMAASIGIVDAGGFYSSDEVEGALQEIGGASSTGRLNGVVTGFGYSAVGLVVTFDTPSTANVPTLRTYSGETVTLPDNTPSVWVYIDPATGNIAQVAAANPPSITAPENVLLWRFTTLAGAITSARDARLYVGNLDRKLPFTVRSSGPQADQESEACFVTFDAVLTYLTYATTLNGLRTEVVVRGSVDTGPIDLPTFADGLHIRGEDGGALVLTSGVYLIDVRGRDGVTIADMLLQTDVVGATAIVDTVGSAQALSVERCDIIGGVSSWTGGVVLSNPTGAVTVSNCRVSALNTGISISDPNSALIDQVDVFTVNLLPGSVGIRIGVPPSVPGERPGTVRACTVTGFDTGISVSGVGHVVTGCSVTPGIGGVDGILVGVSTDVTVSSNRIDCGANSGLRGIRAIGTAANKVTGLRVRGNTVYGATTHGIQITGFVQESSVTDNQVDCNVSAAPANPTALAAIYLHSSGGPTDVPAYNTVSGNTVWRARTGIYMIGTATQQVQQTVVSGNVVHHCAVGTAGPPAGPFDVSVGIGAEWCAGLGVTSNSVYGIGRILTDAGAVVDPTPAFVASIGVRMMDCEHVDVSANQVRDLFRKGGSPSTGIQFDGPGGVTPLVAAGIRIEGNGIDTVPSTGILALIGSGTAAFSRELVGAVVSGNTVSGVGSGIEVVALGRGTVRELLVCGNTVDTTSVGSGIVVQSNNAPVGIPPGVLAGVSVAGNAVYSTAGDGITVKCDDAASASHVSVERNRVRQPGGSGIEFAAGTNALGGPGAALFEVVSASGNDLVMSGAVGARAILFDCYLSTMSDIAVDDNTIRNTDTGVEVSAAGPVGPSNTVIGGLHIRRNTIDSTNRGLYGNVVGFVNRFLVAENVVDSVQDACIFTFAAVAPSATASNGILVDRNRFRSILGGNNTVLTFGNMKVHDVRAEDNVLVGGDATSPGGIAVLLSGSSTGAAPAVRALSVRRNLFRDVACPGVTVGVGGPTDPVLDASISDNVFENVATGAAGARGSTVVFSVDAEVQNLSVLANQFTGCGHATATHGGIDIIVGSCRGVDVSDNQFDVGTGTAYGSIVSVDMSATPGGINDLSIRRNKSRGVVVPAGSVTGSLVTVDLQGATGVAGVTVSDNDLNRVARPVGSYGGVDVHTDVLTRGVSCDRNRVTGADAGVPIVATAVTLTFDAGVRAASASDNAVLGSDTLGAQSLGIGFYFGSASESVRVCGNTVRGNNAVNPTNGIFIEDTGTSAISDLRVAGNTVTSYIDPYVVRVEDVGDMQFQGNTALSFDGTCFEFTAAGTCARLTFDGNRCQSGNTPVLAWDLDLGTGCRVLTFSHNEVGLSATPSTAMSLTTGGVGVGANKNFVFTGNVFRGSNLGIVYASTGGPGTRPDSCTFMGNIGDTTPGLAQSWSQFEVGGGAVWTNVLPPAGAGAGQFQTFNIDDGT